jgi:nitroreductase
LREIVRKRRSAIEMDGQTRISRERFYNMLSRTLASTDNVPFNVLPWEPLTHLVLFVHRVDDLEPGLYILVRHPAEKENLQTATRPEFLWQRAAGCPEGLDLYLLTASDVRNIAKAYSCDQDIAADSCFSLGMLVEFEHPLQKYGAWFYPRLYWETGLIGQVLYLEAEATTGLRGTGIGCFMDDPVHKLLGLQDKRYQSLYHFTVGGPMEDLRIVDLPAYEEE